MTNEQKAQKYNQLMYEFTKIENKISQIKGESINLNDRQLEEIKKLQNQLRFLTEQSYRL
jgi:hypothetical protein